MTTRIEERRPPWPPGRWCLLRGAPSARSVAQNASNGASRASAGQGEEATTSHFLLLRGFSPWWLCLFGARLLTPPLLRMFLLFHFVLFFLTCSSQLPQRKWSLRRRPNSSESTHRRRPSILSQRLDQRCDEAMASCPEERRRSADDYFRRFVRYCARCSRTSWFVRRFVQGNLHLSALLVCVMYHLGSCSACALRRLRTRALHNTLKTMKAGLRSS